MSMLAQINLSIRNPGHRPPYVEAVVWPYGSSWHRPGPDTPDAFSRPARGPGTLRIAVPPPSDTPGTVEHFLFILASEVSSLYEFPVPDDYFVLPGQQRRDYVVAWLHNRVAALGIDRQSRSRPPTAPAAASSPVTGTARSCCWRSSPRAGRCRDDRG